MSLEIHSLLTERSYRSENDLDWGCADGVEGTSHCQAPKSREIHCAFCIAVAEHVPMLLQVPGYLVNRIAAICLIHSRLEGE
jgi:hypothetical protein